MRREIWLPHPDGSKELYIPRARLHPFPPKVAGNPEPVREVDAAVHVVINPNYSGPSTPPFELDIIDWKTTAQIREYIWNAGLGVADGMDTAQRDHLPRRHVEYLLRQTAEQANGRRWYFGAGTDEITTDNPTNAEIAQAYIKQMLQIQRLGGKVAIFPSPYLAGRSEEDYLGVFREINTAAEGPLLLHWLGEVFNPKMKDYFPGNSFYRIMEMENFESTKLSLLDAEREIEIRRHLAKIGKVVKTGDDFHYVELIEGTDEPIGEGVYESAGHRYPIGDYSHALLGCMSTIEDVAGYALDALAVNDKRLYRRWLEPTVPLSHWVFQTPTAAYKHGVAMVAQLRGKQDNDLLLPNNPNRRDLWHKITLFRLMDAAGLFSTEEQAYEAYRRHLVPYLN
ncbi:MAG: hypothetical protein KatS3mg115_2497 [Candidatus Poribacteria bacterium]|nr:MAG: hypothetical protein KatS3mg115_2497 [Candidatus Poribacteria bacterium]